MENYHLNSRNNLPEDFSLRLTAEFIKNDGDTDENLEFLSLTKSSEDLKTFCQSLSIDQNEGGINDLMYDSFIRDQLINVEMNIELDQGKLNNEREEILEFD